MKPLKQNENAVIMCIIEVVAGILLLVNPVGFAAGIIVATGIALMDSGLLNVIRYFRSSPMEAAAGQLLMRGLIALLAGAFCAFNAEWFIVTFPMIAILYGVAVLASGLGKVQIAIDMLRAKNSKWWCHQCSYFHHLRFYNDQQSFFFHGCAVVVHRHLPDRRGCI